MHGKFHLLLRFHGAGEHRCLGEFEPHIKSHPDQDSTGEERDAPAPRAELGIVERLRQQQKTADRQQETDRGA